MQEQDIQAWEREIKHNQMMRESRERPMTILELIKLKRIKGKIPFNTYSAKDSKDEK